MNTGKEVLLCHAIVYFQSVIINQYAGHAVNEPLVSLKLNVRKSCGVVIDNVNTTNNKKPKQKTCLIDKVGKIFTTKMAKRNICQLSFI